MSGSAFAVTHHAFSSGAGRTSDGNGSHASTLKSPSYTKSVSWQHYRRAIRYNFQVDDAKFRRDNVKEIISTLFANKVDVDHPENKYKDFKDLEDKVEKRLQNRQTEYQNEINQLSAPDVNFDDI
ncbi:transposase [Shigella boydii]|nr:transposase [Shigella boydii]